MCAFYNIVAMKTRITDAIFVALLAAALIWSCSKSTILGSSEEDTPETYTPRTKSDSTATEDTSRTPITFTVEVEGWKEITINE